MVSEPLLELRGIRKSFPNGTVALKGVDLSVTPGRVHGLVGANGAGKSTLIKVIAGAHPPTEGELAWRGRPVEWRDPGAARRAGLATIYQHIPLVPTLSVLENVFLDAPGPWRSTRRTEFRALLERVHYTIPPDVLVADLPIGERQMVAILQALAAGADLVIMDEPTASLAASERQVVFDVVRRLRDQGTAFLYVSHFLEEILDLTDEVTIIRDGRVVLHGPTGDLDQGSLAQAIAGRELLAVEHAANAAPCHDAAELLTVRGLSSPAGVREVSFTVRAGEVVGLAGLLGSGRSEILHAVYGSDRSASGQVTLDGRAVQRSPAHAVRAGLALVPEDRAEQGLVGQFPLWQNTSLPDLARLSHAGILPREDEELARAHRAIEDLGIVAPGPGALPGELSGGNAQKVVFAKWVYGGARVFLLDEPTAGVDVGAKADILALIRDFAAQGKAVVIVSSEFEELLSVATRVLVVRNGRIVAERAADQSSEEELLLLANGFTADQEREDSHGAA